MKNHLRDQHIPVLLNEVLQAFSVSFGKKYIDATLGFGGHSLAMAELGGTVLGIDKDKFVLKLFKKNNKNNKILNKITFVHGTFSEIKELAHKYQFTNVDGILMDLGISSWHIDESGRGFTFSKNEPLDMRLDTDQTSVTAEILINSSTEPELYYIIAKFAEDEYAHAIVKQILQRRPIYTSYELKQCVDAVVPKHEIRNHNARVFQAFRIAVNDELQELSKALVDALSLIKPGGSLIVISFHSLEDRIVKRTFKKYESLFKLEKLIRPSNNETMRNSRSKSARMRIATKI